MSDRLSAASLLLAIVAVLYGMWYPQLVEALATRVPEFAADRRRPLKVVIEVRTQRALPLTLAALGVAAVFLPDTAAIVIRSLKIAADDGWRAVRDYDSVAMAFVLVEVLALYFAQHFIMMWIDFGRLLKRLSVSPTATG